MLKNVRAFAEPVPYIHKNGAVTWVNLDPQCIKTIQSQETISLGQHEKAVPSEPARLKQSTATLHKSPHKNDNPRQLEKSKQAKSFRGGTLVGETSLTEGNIKNNHFYLRGFINQFPDDIIGRSNKQSLASQMVDVDWAGERLSKTDIDGSKLFFRDRASTKAFFNTFKAAPGDVVQVYETAPYAYRVELKK